MIFILKKSVGIVSVAGSILWDFQKELNSAISANLDGREKLAIMNEAQKNQLNKLISQTLHLFDMGDFKFYLDEKTYAKDTESSFRVEQKYPYRQIIFYLAKAGRDFIRKNQWETVERLLIHEAVHVLFWRFYLLAADRFIQEKDILNEREVVADKVGNLIIKLLKLSKKREVIKNG